jgi:DNA-binding response OmpR family regulator
MKSESGRILIVDDEPNVRLVFRTALESAGYAVSEVEDGESALDRLEESSADLVLLDLKMPGIGGMETLRRLRDAGNDVPVVIVTAHGSIPDAVQAMKFGAIDFLSKPLRPEALRKIVGEVFRRHAHPEPRREPAPTPARPAPPTAVVVAAPVLDLTAAKRALNRREFVRAADLLEEALELAPDSAEAQTLMGVLRECLGQDHAAYHAYRAALHADPHYGPARDNLQRYCERFGLDFRNRSINPAAGE